MVDQIDREVLAFYKTAYNDPYFGQWLKKAGNVSGMAGAINPTYGAVVFDQINREQNAHAIIKKTSWDTSRSGFRVTTSNPATKGYGGADGGTVGTVVDSTPTELDTIPAFLHTPFDLTVDAAFRIAHDDGMNGWEWKLQNTRDVHAQLFDEEFLRSAQAESDDIGANNTTDAKNDTNGNGKGLESLDRMLSSDAEEDAVAGAGTGHFDVYEQTSGSVLGDRDADTGWDSVVVDPDGDSDTLGTNVPFQMAGIDTLLDDTGSNGADISDQIFLTRQDTRRAFYNELGTAGRQNLTEVEMALSYSGLSPHALHPGRDVTFTLRTYQGVPIVVDKNVPSNGTANTFPNGGTGLGHWYVIDQSYAELKVGIPTVLVSSDNIILLNNFSSKGMWFTSEQLFYHRVNTSGKVRSILS